MPPLSRRKFVALSAAGAAGAPFLVSGFAPASHALTAQEVVDRIRKNVGADWGEDGVDTFKAGDPSTMVTGIVTTSMATLDVLRKAVQAGANLVITAAPTFYSRADLRELAGRGGPGAAGGRGAPRGGGPGTTPPPSPAAVSGPGTGASAPMPPAPPLPAAVVPPPPRGAFAPGAAVVLPDPVYGGKNAYIDQHQLVIYRLTEHWNRRSPDPRALGLAAAMGWTRLRQGYGGQASDRTADDSLHYEIPAITLEALAGQLKKALGARGGIRAVGDRALTVRKIGLLPGFTLIKDAIAMLSTADVVITGEVQEWESATYVQDVAFAGLKKGFVSIGRVVNEAPGMQVCAEWLKTIVAEVPVRCIPAGDPYWRPL